MPKSKSTATRRKSNVDTRLSTRTKKQIDSLPEHAQHVYKKAHANAIKQYQNPEKRRGGKGQSAEEVAHKTAWAAVKQKYKKQGDEWCESIDDMVRPTEIGEELDFCSACKIGYLKQAGEVVVKGESAVGYRDIGTRRVFKCDNCKQRQVRVARREYVIIGDDVKTKFTEDKS